ncbi:MAG: hypothetical protein KDA42_07235 [Planctomycetales bacterium]|nr:hypothetical protein [Planctomycetales bacterium]
MSSDLFEQLAEIDVPPIPDHLDQPVHDQVNRWLLVVQLGEFVLRCLPLAAWTFCRAVFCFVLFTLTGIFPSETKRR